MCSNEVRFNLVCHHFFFSAAFFFKNPGSRAKIMNHGCRPTHNPATVKLGEMNILASLCSMWDVQ